MTEEYKNSSIVSTKDLGNGTKQVTFKVDANHIDQYFEALQDKENIVIQNDVKLGTGSVKTRYEPKYVPTHTSNDTPYTTALRIPEDPHKKIQMAVELYHKEPIIGTVIDLMVDFSASGFENDCEDDKVKKLFDEWCKKIKMADLIENILLEYFRSGNVTIYRSNKNARVKKTTKTNKQAEASVEEFKFPAGYTVLNPMNVYVEGSLLFNQEVVSLLLNGDIIEFVKSGDKSVKDVLPTEMIKAVRSGNSKVVLNKEYVTRITRKRQPYERYASPFLERIFEPVIYKQKLRAMDMSTIEGLVNQLVTVTIGNDEYPATDKDLEAIAELFATPNKAYTLFWNHTLNVQFHKPEGHETLTDDKYKQVNDDILAGLGVSRVLLDGQGANFSTAWVSILSLIERLDNARQKIMAWIEEEYARIAEENGFKVYPKVRFNKMNLREDTYIRDVLLAMYDRGLIDEEDILRETGRDYDAVIEMKKRNEKNAELFFPPEQPFQGGNTGTNDGKPTGKNPNGYSKRKTSPEQNSGNAPKPKTSKATAYYRNLEEDYEAELEEYYNEVFSEVVATLSEAEQDNSLLELLIVATILSSFKGMREIGYRHISQAFDFEANKYGIDSYNSPKKKELRSWNDSYVIKLANDISSNVKNNLQKGLNIHESVNKAFSSEKYRVKLLSQAGIIESVRQASIESNVALGTQTAIWRTVLDDATCNTCRGLHGREFNINDIPPRPHSGCRCELEFN